MQPSKRKFQKPNPIVFTSIPNNNLNINPHNMLVRTFKSQRPIDKQLIAINLTNIDATQQNTTLITATFPCTLVGIRWSLGVIQDGGTTVSSNFWCINILRDGVTQPAISKTNAASFFTPETNCLAFGVALIDNNTNEVSFEGNTKTMRKMQGGDKLIFSSLGDASNTSRVLGVIQFFCKT